MKEWALWTAFCRLFDLQEPSPIPPPQPPPSSPASSPQAISQLRRLSGSSEPNFVPKQWRDNLSLLPKLTPEEKRRRLIAEFDNMPGRHTENSPLLGKHSETLKKFTSIALKNPAILRFGYALYHDQAYFPHEVEFRPSHDQENNVPIYTIIPWDQKEKADALSHSLYKTYCQEQNVAAERQIDWSDLDFRKGVTYINDVENEWNVWNLQVVVEKEGRPVKYRGLNSYLPPYLLALHELRHVERIEPLAKDHRRSDIEEAIEEIGPSIELLIDSDYVYKQIHGIPLDQEVVYSGKLPTKEGNGINLGLIANTFRELKKKYGSIEEALISTEGMAFALKFYSNASLKLKSKPSPPAPKPIAYSDRTVKMPPSKPSSDDFFGEWR